MNSLREHVVVRGQKGGGARPPAVRDDEVLAQTVHRMFTVVLGYSSRLGLLLVQAVSDSVIRFRNTVPQYGSAILTWRNPILKMDPLQGRVTGVDLGVDILFRAETVQDHLRFEKIHTRPDGGTTFWL